MELEEQAVVALEELPGKGTLAVGQVITVEVEVVGLGQQEPLPVTIMEEQEALAYPRI